MYDKIINPSEYLTLVEFCHFISNFNCLSVIMEMTGIPRREYVNKVIEIAKRSGINFQLEVESSGGSDGNALQRSDFNWDWCFVGAPEDYVHSPNEKVYKTDIKSMNELYKVLLEQL